MTNKLLYDDKALAIQVSEGSERAFTMLFEKWQPVMATYIFRITRSREIAVEIVQDVFLKIWTNREMLGSVDNFSAYLFVISRNLAINALKKSLREINQLQELQKINLSDNTIVHPAEEAERNQEDLSSLLDEAIDHLSPRQKQVYLLHKHHLLSYKEIAQNLGIGTESVKSHMGLAVKAITKYLRGGKASISIFIAIFF